MMFEVFYAAYDEDNDDGTTVDTQEEFFASDWDEARARVAEEIEPFADEIYWLRRTDIE